MNKPNIFKSSRFFMDAGDVLHILVKDLTGTGVTIGLNDGEGTQEDGENVGFTTTLVTTTTTAPLNPTSIYITTDIIATDFEITISSSTKDVVINWGDGSAPESISLIGMGAVVVTHTFLVPSEIEIENADGLEEFICTETGAITSIIIPPSCVLMQNIQIMFSHITSFETHEEWVNLRYLNLTDCGLSSLNTYPTWVLLEEFEVEENSLTDIELHPEWVNLTRLELGVNNIESITLPSEYINLDVLSLRDLPITSIIIPTEYLSLSWLVLDNSDIISLVIPATFVDIKAISADYTPLTTFEVHSEWTLLSALYLRGCSISIDSDINNILIGLDAISGGGSLSLIQLMEGTNAIPTGAGIIAKNSLIGKGITVTTN